MGSCIGLWAISRRRDDSYLRHINTDQTARDMLRIVEAQRYSIGAFRKFIQLRSRNLTNVLSTWVRERFRRALCVHVSSTSLVSLERFT